MELIGKSYTLNEAQQRKFVLLNIRTLAVLFGIVSCVLFLLLGFVLKAPLFLLGTILLGIGAVFLPILLIRYFVAMKLASAYVVSFDEDGITAGYDSTKMGSLVGGLSQIGASRSGAQLNQFISYRKISYIRMKSYGFKIYSVDANPMNADGIITIHQFLDDYEKMKFFFETKYKKD